MNTLQHLTKIGLTALVLLVTLPGLAQAPAPGPGPHGPGHMGGPEMRGEWWSRPEVAERINLTDQQRQQIEDLVYESGQRLIDLHAEVQRGRLELNRQLEGETLDESAIAGTLDQLAGAECAVQRERLGLRVGIARVLTSEQRTALRTMVREHRHERRERPAEERERFRQRAR